jgi:hypothetical protein
MNRRLKRASRITAVGLCLALAPLQLISASPAVAAAPFHFQHESMQQFQTQLAAAQIHAATFNKVAHTLHLSMNDHNHFLVVYPPLEYKKIVASLEAKNVPVAVLKHAKKTTTAKPAHHKLRYIAGAILVLIILAALLMSLMSRRRALLQSTEGSSGEGAEEPSSASPPTSG